MQLKDDFAIASEAGLCYSRGMNSKSIGDRLKQWSLPGCLMNPNETVNWLWMKEIEIGEHIDIADNSARNNASTLAARYGIRVMTKKLDNGDFRVIRIG